LFFDAYGIEPDEQRIAFHRLLYDLASQPRSSLTATPRVRLEIHWEQHVQLPLQIFMRFVDRHGLRLQCPTTARSSTSSRAWLTGHLARSGSVACHAACHDARSLT
jgi:hypothetical protein